MLRYLFIVLFGCLSQFVIADGLLETQSVSETDKKNPQAITPSKPEIPEFLSTPQATFAYFVKNMQAIRNEEVADFDEVLQTLDLSEINKLVRQEKGTELAWILLEIIERTPLLDPDFMPIELNEKQTEVTLYWYIEGNISLSKQEDGRWLFSKKTLADSSLILEGMNDEAVEFNPVKPKTAPLPLHLSIKQYIPKSLKSPLLSLQLWQWMGILLVLIIGIVVDKIVQYLLKTMIVVGLYRLARGFYKTTSSQILRPIALIAMAGVWWAGLNLLSLPENALLILLLAAKFLLGLSAVWSMLRLIDLVSAYFADKALYTETKLDNMLVPLITKIAKGFIIVAGLVFLANILQMNITGLLAGLGLGGLAFALAAKDAVENVFGSITVLMDRPFVVGDWVIIDDIEGTVENIGFRSTRIRTFYNSLITLPNSRLITAHVDNMGRRSYRRFRCHLGVTYETPADKVDAFCQGIRQLVLDHPQTRKDYFHVYFNEYAAYSLNILVYIFFRVDDWGVELQARHDFLLQVLKLAEKMDVEFAFPTQTLHLQAQQAEMPIQPLQMPE